VDLCTDSTTCKNSTTLQYTFSNCTTSAVNCASGFNCITNACYKRPVITISFPTEGQSVVGSINNFTARVVDNYNANLSCNWGISGSAARSGTTSFNNNSLKSVTFTSISVIGSYTLGIGCTNSKGATGSIARNFTLVATEPTCVSGQTCLTNATCTACGSNFACWNGRCCPSGHYWSASLNECVPAVDNCTPLLSTRWTPSAQGCCSAQYEVNGEWFNDWKNMIVLE
jgi:hypothetical protein